MTRAAKWIIGGALRTDYRRSAVSLVLDVGDSRWGHVELRHEATDLIARFHEHFNSGDLDGLVGDMSTRPEQTRKIWQPVLQELKSRCRNFRSVVKSSIDVIIEPSSVQAHNVSSFEKGQLKEDFVMSYSDESLKIT